MPDVTTHAITLLTEMQLWKLGMKNKPTKLNRKWPTETSDHPKNDKEDGKAHIGQKQTATKTNQEIRVRETRNEEKQVNQDLNKNCYLTSKLRNLHQQHRRPGALHYFHFYNQPNRRWIQQSDHLWIRQRRLGYRGSKLSLSSRSK